MQTRLLFSDSKRNLKLAYKQLKQKYGSLEELFRQVQKGRCNAPEVIDDYMLWQTINAHEKELTELGIIIHHGPSTGSGGKDVGVDTERNNQELAQPRPSSLELTLKFTEDILIYTTDFYQVLTPRRVELMEYIYNNSPGSVKDLAKKLQRDYKNVYDDLLALQKFHLMDFVREGKNKRPVARVTAIEVLFNK